MWKQILMSLIAAAYTASPIDAIPDILPVIGQLDDAAVIGVAVIFWLRWWTRRKQTGQPLAKAR